MPIVQFLRDCGYHVVEAASTDEAIAILQNTDMPVDVVLSEIDIPGSMNGFGFAQWNRLQIAGAKQDVESFRPS
jgi:CheY-like chemotaxis protein